MKSIYLYKGYLVVNTAAMNPRLKAACRDAFLHMDRYTYAFRMAGKDTSANPSVYEWLKDSGLLKATERYDFDF